jgi:hypothetical protein
MGWKGKFNEKAFGGFNGRRRLLHIKSAALKEYFSWCLVRSGELDVFTRFAF